MPSRRATRIAFAVALAAGLCALLAGSLTTTSRLAKTLGVLPVLPVAPLRTSDEACQSPIGLADPVERVRFNIGTFGKSGPPLAVMVRAASSGRVIGQGLVAAGWVDDGTAQEVYVGRLSADQAVAVCVRNLGPTKAYLWGSYSWATPPAGPAGATPTISTSAATLDGQEIPGDISLAFVTRERRSLLSRLPSAFRHASVFRPAFVGAWTFWLLASLILVGAPLLLYRALKTAADEPGGEASLPSSPRR